jgi:hypothetical protein
MSRKLLIVVVAALTALAALGLGAVPAPAKHGDDNNTSKLEGRVLSVNRTARTFRLRDSERGTATIVVTRSTKFDRIRFSQVRPGKQLEVRYRVANGRKVATKVEPGGNHAS